ncbi:hypothetical protein PILCRDRAFT_815743 [Piloderma croceum F 1598]|uniref:Uncharacterized protein n=1 Tax=Piloderma croceum (strain F 1598) TaxID=765440 RepID=A0A0C3G3M2_PILCF|nr:hypothetical protein PILCRDRAFT_815743 [Piloderma croceum F 1598]
MGLLVVGTIHLPCEQVLAALWRVGVGLHWDVFPQSCVEADKVSLAECVHAYLTGMPLHRSPGVHLHPPGPN